MDNYINKLDDNTHKLLDAIKDISTEKLNARKENEWTILEILEHIYNSDQAIYTLLKTPSNKESETAEIVGQKKLENFLVDQRHHKVQAPRMLHPKGSFQKLDDFKTAFVDLRNIIKDGLITKEIMVDNRIHKHFIIGEMTITDWLHMIIFHTERHLKQIEDKFQTK